MSNIREKVKKAAVKFYKEYMTKPVSRKEKEKYKREVAAREYIRDHRVLFLEVSPTPTVRYRLYFGPPELSNSDAFEGDTIHEVVELFKKEIQ